MRARPVVFAAGLLAAGLLFAAERVHVVAPGESPGSLAKEYYGDKALGELLLYFNGKPGKVIHPGERLTIPSCATYRAKAGDTWSALAKRHLGRAAAGPVLAELNGYDAGRPLKVGARLVMPVVLRHTLARGETLSALADRYYGDARKAALVQEFSRIEDVNRLAVGTPLEIPLVAFVRVKAPAPTPAPPPAPVPAPAPAPEQPQFGEPLAAAGRSFLDGEYEHARETLEALGKRVALEGTAPDRREWGRLMAFVYIALDRDVDACAAYRSGPDAGRPADLDPDAVSPRIRNVLTSCPAPTPEDPNHVTQR